MFLSHVDMIKEDLIWTVWTRHHTIQCLEKEKKSACFEEFIVLIGVYSSFVGKGLL